MFSVTSVGGVVLAFSSSILAAFQIELLWFELLPWSQCHIILVDPDEWMSIGIPPLPLLVVGRALQGRGTPK